MLKTVKIEDVEKVIWYKEGQNALKKLILIAERMDLEVRLTDSQDGFTVCSKKMPDVCFKEVVPINILTLECAAQFVGLMAKYNAWMFGQVGVDEEGELAMRRITALKWRAAAIGCDVVYVVRHPVADDVECVFYNIRTLYYRRSKRIYKVSNALSNKHHYRRNEYVFAKNELGELEKYIAHDEALYMQCGDE